MNEANIEQYIKQFVYKRQIGTCEVNAKRKIEMKQIKTAKLAKGRELNACGINPYPTFEPEIKLWKNKQITSTL